MNTSSAPGGRESRPRPSAPGAAARPQGPSCAGSQADPEGASPRKPHIRQGQDPPGRTGPERHPSAYLRVDPRSAPSGWPAAPAHARAGRCASRPRGARLAGGTRARPPIGPRPEPRRLSRSARCRGFTSSARGSGQGTPLAVQVHLALVNVIHCICI